MRRQTPMIYDRKVHAAARTEEYVFHQLIPYIGNKRKLLGLIGRAIDLAALSPGARFLDLFAGSGVVSRYAKQRGFQVFSNDWEPYATAINRCYVGCDEAPTFGGATYEEMIRRLNCLPPVEGWVTRHLCPTDDEAIDPARDRLFYMRKNGMRIDAIRSWIDEAEGSGDLTAEQRDCLLAPLLYAACYTSNTSGVFKGFHNGWGGQTGTALYRITSDLTLRPAEFLANGRRCAIFQRDATLLADELRGASIDFAYLDPPYNQHPYGSNYHVLNTIALWDAPPLSPKISGRGDKSGIRTDWREIRRSKYNHRGAAAEEYRRLLEGIDARFIATSYSTDGMIPLESLVTSNLARGAVQVLTQGYKRYRVSSQRFSKKPMNLEFILLTDTGRRGEQSVAEIVEAVAREESRVLRAHAESGR